SSLKKQTFPSAACMFAKCQTQTKCGAAKASLFDYLVDVCEQRCRHVETECLRGLEVDWQARIWWPFAPAGRPMRRVAALMAYSANDPQVQERNALIQRLL